MNYIKYSTNYLELKRNLDDGGPDRSCVVGIPVKYNDEQISLIEQACKAAGFSYVEFLDEPVAAAMSLGLD